MPVFLVKVASNRESWWTGSGLIVRVGGQVPAFPVKVAAQHNPLCDASNQITVPISLSLSLDVYLDRYR